MATAKKTYTSLKKQAKTVPVKPETFLAEIEKQIQDSVKNLITAKISLLKFMKPSEAEELFDKIIESEKSKFNQKPKTKTTNKP